MCLSFTDYLTEVWIQGTDWQLSSGEQGWGPGWKMVKGLAKEHICTTHRQTTVWWWPEGRGIQGLGGGEQSGENGGVCNSVDNKNKVEKRSCQFWLPRTIMEAPILC